MERRCCRRLSDKNLLIAGVAEECLALLRINFSISSLQLRVFPERQASFVLRFMLICSAWSALLLEQNIGSRLRAECFEFIFH